MSREITNGSSTVEVVEHVMLRNMWEYYLIEPADDDGIAFALVCGIDVEFGSVYQSDIDQYGISRTTQLDEILPPVGWSWADGEDEQ